MRILIIRHGDPHYPTNTLTEKGQREVDLLTQKLVKEGITNIYVSPLGRAIHTAQPTADIIGIKPVILDWLSEFPSMLNWEYNTDFWQNMPSPWNIPPEHWVKDPLIYGQDWRNSELLKGSQVAETYDKVMKKFDELLAEHGFEREGGLYNITEKGENNTDTIALFCHFGIGTAMIAHVLNMPLIPIWNSIFLPPSSVTTLYMERHLQERPLAHGIFTGIGDVSHLYVGNEPISCLGLHTNVLE